MELTIIIDRVGNTNVFNVVSSDPSQSILNTNESMQTEIDIDLIEEYLHELDRVANLSKSLTNLPKENEENQALVFQHFNLNEKIRQVGQVLFRQFFPEQLQKYLRESQDTFLFFQLDPQLASIPFEILNDGDNYLWEKFYLGKSIKGKHSNFEKVAPRDSINMLIVADPCEDLDWARLEGEMLFENLSTQFNDRQVSVELIGGKSVTKLSLLNALENKDIIHYCGHLHYSENSEENGWLLFNNKILRAREIKKSGAQPSLFFSNSCISGRSSNEDVTNDWYANFASSFLKSGKTSYIGTNWEIKDNKPTIEFTVHFYRNLLEGQSLGQALSSARHFVYENYSLNDLTWSSYLLMGNPQTVIFAENDAIPDITRHILDPSLVTYGYPFIIAQPFLEFQSLQKEKEKTGNPNIDLVEPLFELLDKTILLLAAVVYANFQYLKLPGENIFNPNNILQTIDSLYGSLKTINNLKVGLLVHNLFSTLYVHKDSIYKILSWRIDGGYEKKLEEHRESFEITMQYIIENFLMDLEPLKNSGFYRIIEPGHKQWSLKGVTENHNLKDVLLPTQATKTNYNLLLEKTQSLIGSFVFYNPIKKIFLDLSKFIEVSLVSKKDSSIEYDISFHACGVSQQKEKKRETKKLVT